MDQLINSSHAKLVGGMRAWVLAESRRAYGSPIDDATLQHWVRSSLASLMTDRTRVMTFVPIFAMRDIQQFVEQFRSAAA